MKETLLRRHLTERLEELRRTWLSMHKHKDDGILGILLKMSLDPAVRMALVLGGIPLLAPLGNVKDEEKEASVCAARGFVYGMCGLEKEANGFTKVVIQTPSWADLFTGVLHVFPYSLEYSSLTPAQPLTCELYWSHGRLLARFCVGYHVREKLFGSSRTALLEKICKECINEHYHAIALLAGLLDARGHIDVERGVLDLRLSDRELVCSLADALSQALGRKVECKPAKGGRLYRITVGGAELASWVSKYMLNPAKRVRVAMLRARSSFRVSSEFKRNLEKALNRYEQPHTCRSLMDCKRIVADIVATGEAIAAFDGLGETPLASIP